MSVELSEQTTENSSIREEVDFKVCEKEITYKEETKVGRMYTFCYRDGVPLIAIGPDWRFYVGLSSTILVVFSLFMYYLWHILHPFFKFIVPISYAIQVLSYSYTVFINPGIRNNNIKYREIRMVRQDEGEVVKNYTVCNKCNIYSYDEDKVQHCYSCDVCVEERDHHCPWTTKCVGKNNLISFYIFVGSSGILMACLYIGLFFALFSK